MEVMLKRPAGDVTSETASSSRSAKRRRAHTADISVIPVSNDADSDSEVVIAAAPVNKDVVSGDGDVISVFPAADDVVVKIGDVSVDPATTDVVSFGGGGDGSVALTVNGVVADSDVGGLTTANGVVSVTLADDDVALSELTRLLEINTVADAPVTCLTFAENTSTSAIVFQTMSTSYITINGNEESCGSSFSDNDSSVMASVYYNNSRSRREQFYTAEEEEEQRGWLNLSAWDTDDAEWAREAPALDEEDWDDATLARFLGEDDIANI